MISIRDGQLTVIRPMPGTPAARAGLKQLDRIVKIDDESTLNMPLDEAVARLRGKPGSKVTVWVVRDGAKGWQKPKRFELMREVIQVESVESRMLVGGIGYVQLEQFQAQHLRRPRGSAGRAARRSRCKGLVLDLRGNPGGLLEQAVCIADIFLSSGTIVTTSSNDPEKRERSCATREGTEPNYPIVVLVRTAAAPAPARSSPARSRTTTAR